MNSKMFARLLRDFAGRVIYAEEAIADGDQGEAAYVLSDLERDLLTKARFFEAEGGAQ